MYSRVNIYIIVNPYYYINIALTPISPSVSIDITPDITPINSPINTPIEIDNEIDNEFDIGSDHDSSNSIAEEYGFDLDEPILFLTNFGSNNTVV